MNILKAVSYIAVAALISGCGANDSDAPASQAAAPIAENTPQLVVPPKTIPDGEISFKEEADRAASQLKCGDSKTIPASDGLGAMYSCISGPAQTAKFFINEEPTTGSVKNAKFVWNDWFKDTGDGIHADRKTALAMLDLILGMYPSKDADKIKKSFLADKDRTFNTDKAVLAYTYHRGPAIDERVLVITPTYTVKNTEKVVVSAKTDYDSCKAQVAKFIGYSQLTSDGEPIQEEGYISFMLDGKNKDLFFCEIHPDRTYKIKAALKGKFPFRYVAHGSL
jgi:hypothetical protein